MDESRKLPRGRQKAELPHEMLDRLAELDPDTGCWLWQGKIGTHGYAYISYRIGPQKRVCRKAATVAWEIANAVEVPAGLEVSHVCPCGGNPMCVNPDHLFAETHSENLKRRRPFSRYKGNVCKRGHSLEGVKLASNGGCPICEKARLAAWREKNPNANREYRAANKDRINALRRESRNKPKEFN